MVFLSATRFLKFLENDIDGYQNHSSPEIARASWWFQLKTNEIEGMVILRTRTSRKWEPKKYGRSQSQKRGCYVLNLNQFKPSCKWIVAGKDITWTPQTPVWNINLLWLSRGNWKKNIINIFKNRSVLFHNLSGQNGAFYFTF